MAEAHTKTGRTLKLSCAQIPSASTEEGGMFLPAKSRSRMCVPSFQSPLWAKASCEQLVQNIETNWGQLEPVPPKKGRIDDWVSWNNNKRWISAGKSGVNRQRPTTYPERMPPPDGMRTRPNIYTSWHFRRNYTWSAVHGSQKSKAWWSASGVEVPGSKTKSNWNSVLCAVNTFGQDKVYRWRQEHNAYCVGGPKTNAFGFVNVPRVVRCRVKFTKTRGKRDWVVNGVEHFDDDDLGVDFA
ncbi:hypothetical protein CDD81_3487 [Ophiocordyceps australis]|uniref:Uncharacterized protein n=1 Tax=Ophiocordyceps australis TaxID=1399860 RepID=A0A2C5XAR5_9HYPO|nr:hypothetical protein CDD81_3487 [Ophiocordyceps australis]